MSRFFKSGRIPDHHRVVLAFWPSNWSNQGSSTHRSQLQTLVGSELRKGESSRSVEDKGPRALEGVELTNKEQYDPGLSRTRAAPALIKELRSAGVKVQANRKRAAAADLQVNQPFVLFFGF